LNKFVKFLPCTITEYTSLLESSEKYKETDSLVLDQYLILADDLATIINKYFQNSLLNVKEKIHSIKNYSSEEETYEMGSLIMLEEFHLLLLVNLTLKTIKLTLFKPNLVKDISTDEEERLLNLSETYLKTYETLFAAE
jgi:hypothetical protein